MMDGYPNAMRLDDYLISMLECSMKISNLLHPINHPFLHFLFFHLFYVLCINAARSNHLKAKFVKHHGLLAHQSSYVLRPASQHHGVGGDGARLRREEADLLFAFVHIGDVDVAANTGVADNIMTGVALASKGRLGNIIVLCRGKCFQTQASTWRVLTYQSAAQS
jgi:hypothetical protein